ncbi:hypothetical protein QQ020_25525 [Fulvivirgaceae bacterium BMA12]|uniref:Group-specific protein n=1 Tax=Agaribacillus aureus TaxID=3051825 RepID=A0ABT8LGG4_9BACT|nr:hypothetical protein [Fulvivirgaceae bacterium BMA12]
MMKITAWVTALTLIFLASTIQVVGQSPTIKWYNTKNEAVFSYQIKCIGELYSGSKFTKWEVVLVNLQSKIVKCDAVIVNPGNQEISEAVEVVIAGEEKSKLIFMRVTSECDKSLRLNFNHLSYRKNKRG